MKRLLYILFLGGVLIAFGLAAPNHARGSTAHSDVLKVTEPGSGMPGWPLPESLIPHHEPGEPFRNGDATHQITRLNTQGMQETVELQGIDAMLANGTMTDPFQGNYRLVGLDKVMFGSYAYSSPNNFSIRSFEYLSPTLNIIENSARNFGNMRYNAIAAGDLNGDFVDEQITAWVDPNDNHIYMNVGELPGSFGKITSAPAVVPHPDGSLDVLARGQDDALWFTHYDGSNWDDWDNTPGGILLSSPAAISRATGELDVFVIGLDNQIYHQHKGSGWEGWNLVDGGGHFPAIALSTPLQLLDPPAAVARSGSQLDLFRLGPDNTLWWAHSSNGVTWEPWQDLGGMLASGPGAIALGDGRMQVYALGMDGDLWYRTHNGDWGNWQWLETPDRVAGNAFPVLTSPGTGQVMVYLKGTQEQVWSALYDGSAWGPWTSLPVTYVGNATEGNMGNGLLLDGPDDHIEVNIDVSETNYAVAFWFKTTCEDCGIYSVVASDGHDRHIYLNAGDVCARVWNDETICTSGIDFSDGLWHHVVHTYDCGVLGQKLYLDGVERVSGLKDCSDFNWQTGVNIGYSADAASRYFEGVIDELAVFSRTLDVSDVTQIYTSGWDGMTGLEMGLHMEETPAVDNTMIADASGNGHHGTFYTGETTIGIMVDAGIGAAITQGDRYLFAQMADGRMQYHVNVSDGLSLQGLEVSQTFDTNRVTMDLPGVDAIENPVLDIKTGYFSGDGRQQVVLTYEDIDNNLRLEVYDMQDGFVLTKTAELTQPISNANWPRVAAGDVDGDGVDEIGFVSLEPLVNQWKMKLQIFELDRDEDGDLTGTLPQISDDDYIFPNWQFGGTLRIVAGDILTETVSTLPNDEFVVLSDWRYNGSDRDLLVWLNLYDYDSAPDEFVYSAQEFHFYAPGDENDYYSSGVGLAVGDFDGPQPGHSPEEIAVTIPKGFPTNHYPDINRYLKVYRFDRNEDGSGYDQVELSSWDVNSGMWSRYTYLDTLVAGDLDQDLVDEIVMVSHMDQDDADGQYFLDVYEFDTIGSGPEYRYPLSYDMAPRAFNLALGDFTGESIRVGPPTYRVQSKMVSPEVFLNLPPMHHDIIKSASGDNVEIVIDNGAQAIHSSGNSSTTSSTSESNREWSLSTGFDIGVGGGGHKVTASLDNTYGENFSTSTTQIDSIEFEDTTTAEYYDQVIYNGTNYAIWEYPVYGLQDGRPDEAQTISVVFPLVKTTNQPTTQQGRLCDENFYAPSHQTYNVWSYDPLGAKSDFEDFDTLIDSKPTSGGTDFSVAMSAVDESMRSSSFQNQISAGLEYSYENSLSIPFIGKAWDFSFRAYANGSYGFGEMSTLSTSFTEASNVQIGFPGNPDPSIYDIKAYLYWAKGGYLVVDYQTGPTLSGSWLLYTKPDPAFILPWYGFPDTDGEFPLTGNDAPPCGLAKQLFTHDIQLDPGYVQNGDTLTMTATVRNFSNVIPPSDVAVRFYLGDPAGGINIGSCSIPRLNLYRKDNLWPQQCQTTWVVNGGSGEEKVYAVIDPSNAFDEMHDGDDAINNNIGYGLLFVANADSFDPGLRLEQTYQSILYEDSSGVGFGLYLPTTNITETFRYELVPINLGEMRSVRDPIQVLAFGGGESEPDQYHTFSPTPAGMMAFYRNEDLLPGMDEADLTLYRLDGYAWVDATCPNYESVRFPKDNRLAVPICRTGIFVLSDEAPLVEFEINLPLVMK